MLLALERIAVAFADDFLDGSKLGADIRLGRFLPDGDERPASANQRPRFVAKRGVIEPLVARWHDAPSIEEGPEAEAFESSWRWCTMSAAS